MIDKLQANKIVKHIMKYYATYAKLALSIMFFYFSFKVSTSGSSLKIVIENLINIIVNDIKILDINIPLTIPILALFLIILIWLKNRLKKIGITKHYFFGSIISASLLLSISSFILTIWFQHTKSLDIMAPELLKSPGILFAIFMGTISILGFTITIHKISENNSLITNYPQLLSVAKKTLDEIVNDAGKNTTVKMIVVTPCNGNISESRSSLYRDYFKTMKRIIDGTASPYVRLEIMYYEDGRDNNDPESFCDKLSKFNNNKFPEIDKVPDSSLKNFYKKYKSDVIDEKFKDAVDIIDLLWNQKSRDRTNGHNFTHKLYPFSDMVGLSIRLILTESAAIVYFPVETDYSREKQKNGITPVTNNLKHVEMMGFFTKQSHIVDWLQGHFDYIKGVNNLTEY